MAKTVLIVEDNELNMKLFRDLLEAHGYQTSGTSNGFEALDLVRVQAGELHLSRRRWHRARGTEPEARAAAQAGRRWQRP